MAKISVVTPTNLGDGIKKNIETKKFDVAIDNQTITLNSVKDLAVNVDALTDDNLIDIQGNKFKINLKRLLWAMLNLPSNDIPATDFDIDFTGLRSATLKGMTFTSNTIGNYQHLSALRHISGPEVVSVSDNAFKDVKLTSIDLPKVKTIGGWAFAGSALAKFDLPEALTIGEYAFSSNKITSVNLPEVETIKNGAFFDNVITSAYLPRLKTIGRDAFFSRDSTTGHVPYILRHAATPFSAFSQIAGYMKPDSATWYVEPENIQEARRVVSEYNTQRQANITVKTFVDFPHPQA